MVHSFYKGELKREDFFKIPPFTDIYLHLKTKTVPEMKKEGVPTLPESAIRQLSEKGQTTLLFGGLSIKFTIIEKDLFSPMQNMTAEETALAEKYK